MMEGKSVLGTYAGRCQNTTLKPPVNAGVVLVLRRIEGNEIFGDLTIHGGLVGGGEFSGVFSDNRLTFVTRDSSNKLVITWTANYDRGSFEGGYVAINSRILATICGLRNQQGVWACQKAGS